MNNTEYQQQTTEYLSTIDQGVATIGPPRNKAQAWLYTALNTFIRDHAKYDRRKVRRDKAQALALMFLKLADLAVRDLHRVRAAETPPTIEELAKSYNYKNLALLQRDGSLPPHKRPYGVS